MAGGPATAVWAWFIGSCMAECIALSGTWDLPAPKGKVANRRSGRISVGLSDRR